MYPCRPETMHVCARARTHTTLNLTPPQLATTNWKVWRHYMVWTCQVWTPSPGLSLYTQSSGQLSQKRNQTNSWMLYSLFAFPARLNCSSKGNTTFVRSILFMTLLFLHFAHVLPASNVMPLHIKTGSQCSGRTEQAATASQTVFISDEEHVRWPIHF